MFATSGTSEGVNFVVGDSVSVSASYNRSARALHVEELDASETNSVCKACLRGEQSQGEGGAPPVGLVKKPPKHSCAKKFFENEFTGTYSSLQQATETTGTVDKGRVWEVLDRNGVFWNRQLQVKRSISYDHMPIHSENIDEAQIYEVSLYECLDCTPMLSSRFWSAEKHLVKINITFWIIRLCPNMW